MSESVTKFQEIQDKIVKNNQEYTNLCTYVGDFTHKVEHFTGKKEDALIKLRNLEKESAKLNESLAAAKALEASEAKAVTEAQAVAQ